MTMYEIAHEVTEIEDLYESAVDENGEPRELNEEEKETLKKWILANEETFKAKFDSYGKFIQNLKINAELAEATRKAYKAELDRLSARAKAATNRMESMKSILLWAMNTMHIDKVKTALFSASIRENPLSVNCDDVKIEEVPDCYLKKEVSKSAISADIKSGKLQVSDSGLVLGADGSILGGIRATKSKSLQIR